MKEDSHQKYIVPAVEQAVRVLLCLTNNSASRMSLTQICAEVGIHKSKAFSILYTLQEYGLVEKDGPTKTYSLGAGLVSMSRRAIDNFNAPRLAEPILETLVAETNCTAVLGLMAASDVFVAAKREGGLDLGVTVRIGRRFPLTLGSHGKAIAAFMEENELERVLNEKELFFHGNRDRFDRARLTEELVRCRSDGYAVELGEITQGINTIAAPVLGIGNKPVGYIVIIGFFPPEDVPCFGPLVAQAGKRLSQQLGATVKQSS